MNQQDPYQSPAQSVNPSTDLSLPPQPERQWAMSSHLTAFTACIGVPFGNILGPLVMYLIKKDEFAFGGDQAKEALNFNISCTIYAAVGIVLAFVLIGIPILIALGIFWIIVTIIAAVKSNEGVVYRYPLCIRLVS